MQYKPHKIYKIIQRPTKTDEDGNFIESDNCCSCYLCDCFLHHIGTYERNGYSGLGVNVNFYINMDKRDDIKYGDEIKVCDAHGNTIGSGKVVDVKNTGGMIFAGMSEYTIVYI